MMKKVILILGVLLLFTSLLFWVIQPEDLQRINTSKIEIENHLNEKKSPVGSYTLNTYLRGGYILKADYTFLGEVVFNNSDREPRNVFLVGEDNNFSVKWIDDETILLETQGTEHILNIFEDTYDFR